MLAQIQNLKNKRDKITINELSFWLVIQIPFW